MNTENNPIEVILVDDHTLFRESLRRMLEEEPGFHVSGDFSTADTAMNAIQRGLAFDVALIDYELASTATLASNGLDLLRRLRQLRPSAKALMVTAGMDIRDLHKAVKQLNAGIFLKTEPPAELVLAIQRTAKGERWISSGAALTLLNDEEPRATSTNVGLSRLTPRESQVLRGILEGLGNKEIGARLDLTESAVKAVVQKLFEKIGVRSRSQLVRYAIETQIDLR
ncbi:two component transcriptional regulator, LuxR family [Bryocella elongata]|uniref:Two component transcriptional regulator, LuxR family n=1 Tax=Bryocella elongata TaxID=863522 RepID=A0A1H5U899_9BACT|nr:response regulator transcription factor [Bryocella elongata]SEF70497.1 two component transcriptional regulator, LuxR family [Bryocella elongata]